MATDFELIETLWNVNDHSTGCVRGMELELIETLWNVNTDDGSESVIKYIRINRNIVECKFSSISTLKYCCIFELIETLWNVNEDYFTAEESAVRINRNILKCRLLS